MRTIHNNFAGSWHTQVCKSYLIQHLVGLDFPSPYFMIKEYLHGFPLTACTKPANTGTRRAPWIQKMGPFRHPLFMPAWLRSMEQVPFGHRKKSNASRERTKKRKKSPALAYLPKLGILIPRFFVSSWYRFLHGSRGETQNAKCVWRRQKHKKKFPSLAPVSLDEESNAKRLEKCWAGP